LKPHLVAAYGWICLKYAGQKAMKWVEVASIVISGGFASVGVVSILAGEAEPLIWMATVLFGACAAYLAYELRRTLVAEHQAKEIDRRFPRADQAALTAKMACDAEITVALAAAFTPDTRPGEPQPPWLAFPAMGVPHIGWRMGDGESYIDSVFWPFWQHLAALIHHGGETGWRA
jgi:hypothetical protein